MNNDNARQTLPCPFCGGEPMGLKPTCTRGSKYEPSDRAYPTLRCRGCYAEVPGDNWDHSCKSAVDKWNNRVPLQSAQPAPETRQDARARFLERQTCDTEIAGLTISARQMRTIAGHLWHEAMLLVPAPKHETRQILELPAGFNKEDLIDVADGLDTYDKTVNIGPVQSDKDELLETSTAYASRFIRAVLAEPETRQNGDLEDVADQIMRHCTSYGTPARDFIVSLLRGLAQAQKEHNASAFDEKSEHKAWDQWEWMNPENDYGDPQKASRQAWMARARLAFASAPAVPADMVMISKDAAAFAAMCCALNNGQTEAFLLSCTSAKVGDQIPDHLLKERQYTQEIRQAVAALTTKPEEAVDAR